MDRVSDEVAALVRSVYGPQASQGIDFVHCSRTTVKSKTEERIFVFTRSHMDVLSARAGVPEASVHYLHFQKIKAGELADEVTMVTGLGQFTLQQCPAAVASCVVRAVAMALRNVFSAVPLPRLLAVEAALITPQLAAELAGPPSKPVRGPCDAFWPSYKFACAFHNVEPRTLGVKEIVIEYHDTRCRTMTADDIGCLDTAYAACPMAYAFCCTFLSRLTTEQGKGTWRGKGEKGI